MKRCSMCYQKTIIFIAVIFIQYLYACGPSADIPPAVNISLHEFGVHEAKFRRIIDHFRHKQDPLALEACFFIINNIKGLKTIEIDSAATPLRQEDDIAAIPENILIHNIELALESSRPKLDSGTLRFNDFCEYILPYRFDDEEVQDWRPLVRTQFSPLIDSLQQKGNLHDTTLCKTFNTKLINGFEFVVGGNLSRFRNWSQLTRDKKGNCLEMCKLILYPLRAYGVAATIDFTPCWANNNGGGHMWNALVRPDGKSIPFMGLESAPHQYHPFTLIENKDKQKCTYRICGKIFRRTFSINKNSLRYITKGRQPIPEIFASERITDVTKEYFSVADIRVKPDLSFFAESQKVAYLGVFSKGRWHATAWALVNDEGMASFGDMALNVLYIPMARRIGFSFAPIAHPLYLDWAGKVITLTPDTNNLTNVKISCLQSRELDQLDAIGRLDWADTSFVPTMEKIAADKLRSRPVNNVNYTLHYWNNGWQPVATRRVNGTELVFNKVPANALYRLTSANGNNKERCFTMENGQQRWW